jgi:hypothetical protein
VSLKRGEASLLEVTMQPDMQLRGRMNLNDMIKSIIEDEDIVATKIIYKRSIKPSQRIDLNRCFGI